MRNERRANDELRKLILVGNLMASRLEHGSELGREIDKILASQWMARLDAVHTRIVISAISDVVANDIRQNGPVAQEIARAYHPPVLEVPAEIGNCDLCGLVDHHLVDGLCPMCRAKFPNAGGEHG